jgi:hypothetical protein
MLLICSHRRYSSFLRAGNFWELPLGMLQTPTTVSPRKQQKITALANGALTTSGADQKHLDLFRSIRVNPSS